MKTIKILKLLSLSALLLCFVTACEDDASEFVASETTPILLEELPFSEITVDGSNPNNPAVTFNWNNADYAQPLVENYSVEFSSDQNFTNPVVATSTQGTSSATLTMSGLNTAVGNAGLAPLQPSMVFVRVTSSIGDQNELPSVSNVVSFSVVPFFNYAFKDLYLVGPASAAGWNNNNNNPIMFRDASDADVFTYTGFFNGGEPLKMLEQRGAWAPQYGEDSPGELIRRATEDDPDPSPINDIEGVSSGYYTFQVNLNDMSFTVSPYDESGSASYSNVSVSGSATSGSVAMTQASFDSHLWIISSTALAPGDIQFTVDGTTWGSDTAFSGTATSGGANIPVIVEDDYEIWFNDLTGEYHLIPIGLSQS